EDEGSGRAQRQDRFGDVRDLRALPVPRGIRAARRDALTGPLQGVETEKGRPRACLFPCPPAAGGFRGSGLGPVSGGVAFDRLGEDPPGFLRVAPAVDPDPLALLEVLVVLEEVADALQPGAAD